MHVLLLEDDEEVSESLLRAFDLREWSCTHAWSLAEARALIAVPRRAGPCGTPKGPEGHPAAAHLHGETAPAAVVTGPLAQQIAQVRVVLDICDQFVGAGPMRPKIDAADIALSSLERHVQDMAQKPCCEKCGTDDVLVRWHEKRPANRQAACRDSMSVLDYGKRPELKSEHLHYHCRRCQFDWTGPVLAALSASGARNRVAREKEEE